MSLLLSVAGLHIIVLTATAMALREGIRGRSCLANFPPHKLELCGQLGKDIIPVRIKHAVGDWDIAYSTAQCQQLSRQLGLRLTPLAGSQ